MAKTNELLNKNMVSHTQRTKLDHDLAAALNESLKRAAGAAEKALQASKTEIRRSILWTALTALLTLLAASGGGYYLGHRAGNEQGQAAGYQAARDEQAAASWANTPAGRRAYAFDQRGDLDMLAHCTGRGWKIEAHAGGNACIPYAYDQRQISGWFIP